MLPRYCAARHERTSRGWLPVPPPSPPLPPARGPPLFPFRRRRRRRRRHPPPPPSAPRRILRRAISSYTPLLPSPPRRLVPTALLLPPTRPSVLSDSRTHRLSILYYMSGPKLLDARTAPPPPCPLRPSLFLYSPVTYSVCRCFPQ